MLHNLLTDSAEFAEKTREIPISEAALYALLGFLVVFAGIIFLIAVVWLVGKVMNTPKTKTEKSDVEVPASIEKPLSQNEDIVDDETLAVIMAALMAYYQKNNPKVEFTVKRIKRV